MDQIKLLPFILPALVTGCIIVNPKDIDTSLDSGFRPASGSDVGTIEISRPDQFNGSKAVYIVLENDAIVGTLANAGHLAWTSKLGKKNIKLEMVWAINCRIFPGRDDKCFDDKKNLYHRTDQDEIPSIDFDLQVNQTCKLEFIPNMFGEDSLEIRREDHG